MTGTYSTSLQVVDQDGAKVISETVEVDYDVTINKLKWNYDTTDTIRTDIFSVSKNRMQLSQKERDVADCIPFPMFCAHRKCCVPLMEPHKLKRYESAFSFYNVDSNINQLDNTKKVEAYFCSSMLYVPFADARDVGRVELRYKQEALDLFLSKMLQIEMNVGSTVDGRVDKGFVWVFDGFGCCCESRTSWSWAKKNMPAEKLADQMIFSILNYWMYEVRYELSEYLNVLSSYLYRTYNTQAILNSTDLETRIVKCAPTRCDEDEYPYLTLSGSSFYQKSSKLNRDPKGRTSYPYKTDISDFVFVRAHYIYSLYASEQFNIVQKGGNLCVLEMRDKLMQTVFVVPECTSHARRSNSYRLLQ
jgi:hypothetical protein